MGTLKTMLCPFLILMQAWISLEETFFVTTQTTVLGNRKNIVPFP